MKTFLSLVLIAASTGFLNAQTYQTAVFPQNDADYQQQDIAVSAGTCSRAYRGIFKEALPKSMSLE